MERKRGTITNLRYIFPSGIAFLFVEDSQGKADVIFVESGIGIRALASAFVSHARKESFVDQLKGHEIVYLTDRLGVMEAFTPAEQWEGRQV